MSNGDVLTLTEIGRRHFPRLIDETILFVKFVRGSEDMVKVYRSGRPSQFDHFHRNFFVETNDGDPDFMTRSKK